MREAAVYGGLSPSHLRLLARKEKLEAWKLGQDWPNYCPTWNCCRIRA